MRKNKCFSKKNGVKLEQKLKKMHSTYISKMNILNCIKNSVAPQVENRGGEDYFTPKCTVKNRERNTAKLSKLYKCKLFKQHDKE